MAQAQRVVESVVGPPTVVDLTAEREPTVVLESVDTRSSSRTLRELQHLTLDELVNTVVQINRNFRIEPA